MNASPITKITSWLKFLGKNLHLVGCATVCCKSEVMLNRGKVLLSNLYTVLVGLAIVDTVLIVILVLEMSVVGVFMKKEPLWYIISYPYIIHPGRGIVQVSLKYYLCPKSTIVLKVWQFRKVFLVSLISS